MCVAEQGRVLAVADDRALVSIRGVARDVPLTVLSVLGIAVAPGDFVLVHTGLAVAVLTAQEASEHTTFRQQGAAHEDP
jgi:hydrogenase assembly chaperone HypC/HupF